MAEIPFTYFPLYFAIYSVAGWLIEFIYRGSVTRSLINPGFLTGPFLPLYGSASLLLITAGILLEGTPLWVAIPVISLIPTLLEYIGGGIAENIAGMRLWDYRDEAFNFQGRICLKFSLYWAVAANIFIFIVHPHLAPLLRQLPADEVDYALMALGGVLALDTIHSIAAMRKVRALIYDAAHYMEETSEEIYERLHHFRRQLRAFGNLRRLLNNAMEDSMLGRLSMKAEEIIHEIRATETYHGDDDPVFLDIIRDIIDHPAFGRLKEYGHHDATIYHHVRRVAYISYRICRKWNLDYRSAARGALLHDFFLYDWRTGRDRPYHGKLHGFLHSRVALRNALKHFDVNPIERDIILRHMWPLTLIPPRYRESFIVTFVDKWVASRELITALRNR